MIDGAWNFRDVAESTGIRPGLFYRSSELSRLADDGRSELRRLGVSDVADLRSPRELDRRGPGLVPDGVEIHLLPFPDLSAAQDGEAPHEHAFTAMLTEDPGDEPVSALASRYMTEEYRRFAMLAGAQRAVRQVVTLLVEGKPVLAHCFAGKDRTGFTVAVVLEAAGIDRDAIMADYLRSNNSVGTLRARILEMIEQRSEAPEALTFAEARLSDEVLGVREEYLLAARQTIDEQYGSLEGYLTAAGVTPEDVAALRSVLLA